MKKNEAENWVEENKNSPRVTVEVEKRVGDLWPDLLITLRNGEKIAVECQHSKKSAETIGERTRELKKHVDQVVWIYSTSNFDREDDEFFFDVDSKTPRV